MRFIRELIADESQSTQLGLIGFLAVALGALLTRAMTFFHHRKAGVSGWSAAQCGVLERVQLLVGLTRIHFWGAFLFIAPSIAAKWPAG